MLIDIFYTLLISYLDQFFRLNRAYCKIISGYNILIYTSTCLFSNHYKNLHVKSGDFERPDVVFGFRTLIYLTKASNLMISLKLTPF